MREIVICLIFLALVSPCGIAQESRQDQNEWHAEGRVTDLSVGSYSPNLILFVFRNGNNQPILCMATGKLAIEICIYWQERKRAESPCRISIIGRLRMHPRRIYVKIVAWGKID